MNSDYFLDAATICNDLIFHLFVPCSAFDEFSDEIRVDHWEFSRQRTSGIQIRGDRLERFYASTDLSGGGRRHECGHQRIPNAFFDTLFESAPVEIALRSDIPQVVLKNAFARGRPFECWIRTMDLSEFYRCFYSGIVNMFEDFAVEVPGFR
ncbi:hypothetical protein NY2A_b837L [Paramecium bursaria Chlorella virus NY2A]|uniref:Uncharacterized protein b837L n=1 Tax=Paramecium bursaria Chlorella virus NY2A TaxID=46021 RepID=A7IY12_PBCVN|nr:hypothetical protein NY2A_b837L [Paramecium bursaria Chlorella virus NY2A]ABT15236.1 hypothetical protein NY2A_b837L [Paramecium bursaria Chlorella virus NY2A]